MDKSLVARAQEIAAASPENMPMRDAMRDAILERFNDPKLMADFAAGLTVGWAKDVRKSSYELPEQATLLDVDRDPVIKTPDGDLVVKRELATAGQIDQWSHEGLQFHRGQSKRFERFRERLTAADLDPAGNYFDQIRALDAGESQ